MYTSTVLASNSVIKTITIQIVYLRSVGDMYCISKEYGRHVLYI